MESLPNDIKIKIIGFIPRRVHPCADIIRTLKINIGYDINEEDFIGELNNVDLIEIRHEYFYHIKHNEFMHEIRSRARSHQNYIWDTYGDDTEDVYVHSFNELSIDAQLDRIAELGELSARRS